MLFSRAQIQQLLNNLLELGPRRLMALGLIGFAVLVTVVGGAYYLSRPEFETLYTGLTREDVTRMASGIQSSTISRNIAGASAAGYSRKIAVLDNLPGAGVYVAAIQRAASSGLYDNVLVATSSSAKQTAIYDGLQKIASATVDDPELDQSPTAQLNALKKALQQYANAPDNTTLAQAAVTSAKDMHQLNVPPEPFVVDEAFRRIYADDRLDFRKLARYDLSILTTAIKQRVNERMQADVVQDVLVEDFNYVSKEEFQKQ